MAIVLKVIALTVILFVCYAVAGGVVEMQGAAREPADAAAGALALVAVCFLDTIILTYVIVRSRWAGWRLMAAVFVVFYGTTTVLSQIETAVFVTRLPPGMLPRLFLMGVFVAAPFSALAVPILGKRKAEAESASNARLVMPSSEWVWKLAVIVAAYLILYFTFGYYVAWKNPAVREYYGGIDAGGFAGQLGRVLRDTPWLVPLQIVRALLWVAIALPVVRMLKGQWLETALVLALIFSVVMNAQLLLPNPYMPQAVRMAHLMETASSNFIFGFLIGWLFARE